MLKEKKSFLIKQRNVSFDLMRILASVLVILLHVAALKSKTIDPATSEWQTMNLYNSFTRCSVPLFLMLNGVFSLRKDIDIKTLYLKKILPLLMIYIVWSFLYVVDTLGIDSITQTRLINILKMMVSGKYHLWFITTLMGIYMLHPILRAIVGYNNGEYLKYYFILFICAGILKPTALLFLTEEHSFYISVLKKIPLELMSYCGYVLLGYYLANLHKRKYKPWILLAVFSAVCVISAVISHRYALSQGKNVGILYPYTTIPTFIESVTLFLFFKNLKGNFSDKIRKIIVFLSPLTFGLYLFHPFVMDQLDGKLGLNSLAFSTVLSVPLVTLLIVFICFAVTFVMTKIPVVKRFWKF